VESKNKEELTEQIPARKVASFDLDQYVTASLPENIIDHFGNQARERSDNLI
jgi:hypothetical protein